MTVRPVGPADLEALVAVAAPVYLEHYADLWRDNGRAYVEQSFSAAALSRDLAKPGVRYWLIGVDGGTAGFMKCVVPQPGDAFTGPAEFARYLYLERLYVRATLVGGGLGRIALNEAEALALEQGLGGVWLRAMAYQLRVAGFYRRHGYRDHSRERLAFKGVITERATMLRMYRPLG